MKYINQSLVLIMILLLGCSGKANSDLPTPEPEDIITELTLSDKKATEKTKALYSNLWAIQKRGFMFGHHDDLYYGRKWINIVGNSDTKAVCGDYPAVFSLDFAEIMDDRSEGNQNNEIRRRCILEARRRGEVITACIHINNPLTGGDSWDNSSNQVVREILLEGSSTNQRFKIWLDRLALFANALLDDQGDPIPVLFRPFHEHTQTWSWWGDSCCTEQEFISLWQFTIRYLRDVKGVHNFIYAISPQMDSDKTRESFLFRWPGDEWVDFIGMDCYHGLNPSALANNVKVISALSKEMKKPCGITETGVEGIKGSDGAPVKNYWTQQILAPVTGRFISMVVMWRNKYDPQETGSHFYSVYPGHPSSADFVKMYNSPLSFFSEDLPDMYQLAKDVRVN